YSSSSLRPHHLLSFPTRRSSDLYAGHAKQAGLIASQCHAGAYANRFVVVVDDDIDPADMDQVVWAMCTRCDPREGMETLRGCWRDRKSTRLNSSHGSISYAVFCL